MGARPTLLLLACAAMCGCAETRIYDRGQLVAIIQGDAVNVTVKTEYGMFHADSLNHSSATSAAYRGGSQIAAAVGSAVVSGLLAKP